MRFGGGSIPDFPCRNLDLRGPAAPKQDASAAELWKTTAWAVGDGPPAAASGAFSFALHVSTSALPSECRALNPYRLSRRECVASHYRFRSLGAGARIDSRLRSLRRILVRSPFRIQAFAGD
jgi:hypothetical protein